MDELIQSALDFLMPPLEGYGTFLGDYWWFVIGAGIVCAVLVFSAALSGTIAELRMQPVMLHFVAGMIVPVAYPAIIYFALPLKEDPKKKAKEKEERQEAEAALQTNEGPPPVEAAPAEAETDMLTEISESQEEVAGPAYDRAFFHGVARDEMGHPRGPFRIVVEKRELRVERILEVLPHVVVVETGTSGRVQTLRLPYMKIDLCEEI